MLSPPVTAAFYTLGCKLNQFETELIADSFARHGTSVTGISSGADIYVINTCTVTSKSDQKARRIIRKVSGENPDSMVIVTGCYAQLEPDALKNLGSNITVVPQAQKDDFFNSLEKLLEVSRNREMDKTFPGKLNDSGESRFRQIRAGYVFHARAFVKIQDGCDNCCAYCRVPLARGASRSAFHGEIVKTVQDIEKMGYSEAVLTGVNISSYNSSGTGLPALVKQILSSTDNIRIRLSSIEPEQITQEYSEIAAHERVCAHFHIPVQSGSNRILSLMGRNYSRDRVFEGVEILRASGRDPFIAADIITGFPGESNLDFEETLELVRDVSFSSLHVFPFSRRKGTSAYSMKNLVPERLSRERAGILRSLSNDLFRVYAVKCKGRIEDAVLEEKVSRRPGIEESTSGCQADTSTGSAADTASAGDAESTAWIGVTGNYLKVKLDAGKPEQGTCLKQGAVVKCRIGEQLPEEGCLFQADFFQ